MPAPNPRTFRFTEAELGAHVLRMCPLLWQDQYNMNEKGMTPMDMHSLLTLLEAIERICTHEKGKPDNNEKSKKSSYKGKKGKKMSRYKFYGPGSQENPI